jgi:uncharacterized protein
MMNKLLLVSVFILSLGIFAFSGCKKSGDGDNNDNFDRKAMFTNYADNYIIPGYNDLVTKLTDLKTKVDEFSASPDTSHLLFLQNSWTVAYLTWQKVEMLEFGPAETVSLRMYMNIYPVSEQKINDNITNGTYDLEAFGNKDAQGFPALNYLLSGLPAAPGGIITYYTTDVNAANRKKYLQDVIGKMLQKAQGVQTAWTTYRTTYIESTGTDVNSSLSKTVNAFVLYYERYLRAGKIGLPVGAMTGISKPELSEAYYSPFIGKDLALTSLNAVKRFYEGVSYDLVTDGKGMKDYLEAIGTKDDNGQPMSAVISTEFDQAINSLMSFNNTIANGVVTDRNTVISIYEQLQDLVPLLKVDMISAFGISVTYVDNDGD